ncbi:hypothetical protein Droror1_Dr00025947 [Drosera rotundifolia]
MLKSLFQLNYLYWLGNNAGINSRNVYDDCRPGGKLWISLEYVQEEFNHVKSDSEPLGWLTDGLIARPSPCRMNLGNNSLVADLRCILLAFGFAIIVSIDDWRLCPLTHKSTMELLFLKID